MEELKFLEEQQVASELIKRVEEFRQTSAMVWVVLNKIDLGTSKSSGRAIFSDLISPSFSSFVSHRIVLSQNNFSLSVLCLKIQPEKQMANIPNANRVIHSFFSIFIVSPLSNISVFCDISNSQTDNIRYFIYFVLSIVSQISE